ncbi:MAG: EGF domain-containing protein [Sandaracinaceae bacterium]
MKDGVLVDSSSRLGVASVRLAALALAWLVLPGTAFAYPDYVNSRYGLTALPASYTNYECSDCHVNSTGGGGAPCGANTGPQPWAPCLNPFGIQYRTRGWSNTLRDEDTDLDGTDNGGELSDGFMDAPAGAAGFPVGAEASCDMLACATAYPSSIACGASHVRCTATRSNGPASVGVNPTSYNYSFGFSCDPGTGPSPPASDTNWSDRCLNISECSGNPCSPGSCAERSLTGWTSPGYDCTCPGGYLDNGTACQLVDACTAGTDTCVAIATCVDTPGNSAVYTCLCPHAGYAGDGRSPGSGCTNINECAANPCGPNGVSCTETPLGSWSAPGYSCTCAAGYGFNGTTCVLQNECTAGTDDCVALATCNDPTTALGDFTCTCPGGYVGNGHSGGTGCVDINECTMGLHDCNINATCTNTPGSFTCACNGPGWVGDGRTCTDYDECMDPVYTSMCDANATCNNAPGTFSCVCNAGYSGSGFTCTDVDECAAGTDDCHANATCTNTPGSFDCACDMGYTGDGRSCADVNECLDPMTLSYCATAATCNNLPGTFECVCNPGFRGDGTTCDDIDECMEGTAGCDTNATCENRIGNYACVCNTGYFGSGLECTDINECTDGTDGCGANEVCVNNIGAPNDCNCAPGYSRAMPGDPCLTRCGDGLVAVGEACDDGNLVAGDGCDGLCDIEPGWACRVLMGTASTCTETCGDGLIDPTEECDDGTNNDDDVADACRTTCRAAWCGDGTVDTGEECDARDANSDETADGCRTTCDSAYCGDGVIDTGELCDAGGGLPGVFESGTCTTSCARDGGILVEDPPVLIGSGCRAAPSRRPGWPAALALGLLAILVRRRRVR